MPYGALKERHDYPLQPSSSRKLTGIAPVFDRAYPLEGFKILDARTLAKQPIFPQTHARSWKMVWMDLLQKKWVETFFNNWIVQDFWFVMNKLSIFGLMMGMMLLGAMFFGVGFLTAYKSFSPTTPASAHPWHQANGSQPVTAGASSGAGQSGLSHFGGEIVERYTQNASLHGANIALGVVGRMQSKVPAALQPFANHAAARASTHVVGSAFDASRLAKENTQKILSHPRQMIGEGAAGPTSQGGPMGQGGVSPMYVSQPQQPQQYGQPQYVYPGQQPAYTHQQHYAPQPQSSGQQYYPAPQQGYVLQSQQYYNPNYAQR
jgi:hypothetical protein